MNQILAIILLFSSQWALAQAPAKYGFTPEENQWMAEQNSTMAQFQTQDFTLFANASDPLSFDLLKSTSVRAIAEYEEAGYLIFSDGFDFASKKAKLGMAKDLPENMQLVIYTGSTSESVVKSIRNNFSNVIEQDRLHVVHMPHASKGFWARDAVPVPVVRWSSQFSEKLTLVDARYYHKFEPDEGFSSLFNSELTKHNYYFEGGNFMANSKNECLVVNKVATQDIPDTIFKNHYGCKELIRLPHVKGIGHADESVKFIDDETVLTDEKSYVSVLESNGYNVVMLPRPDKQYETYVNSLIVNGVVYVPVFDEKKDQKALDVYRQFGFDKVIGLNSKVLSNQGMGSLHCITMTYPDVPMSDLLHSMGGSLL